MKGKLIGGAVALTALGSASGMYAYGESLNDTPAIEVTVAEEALHQREMGYIAVAGEGSCENTVLATLLYTGEDETATDVGRTADAFDDVCGLVKDSIVHTFLAERSADAFRELNAARTHLNKVTDTSEYSGAEKEAAIIVGTIGSLGTIVLAWSVALKLREYQDIRRSRPYCPA